MTECPRHLLNNRRAKSQLMAAEHQAIREVQTVLFHDSESPFSGGKPAPRAQRLGWQMYTNHNTTSHYQSATRLRYVRRHGDWAAFR